MVVVVYGAAVDRWQPAAASESGQGQVAVVASVPVNHSRSHACLSPPASLVSVLCTVLLYCIARTVVHPPPPGQRASVAGSTGRRRAHRARRRVPGSVFLAASCQMQQKEKRHPAPRRRTTPRLQAQDWLQAAGVPCWVSSSCSRCGLAPPRRESSTAWSWALLACDFSNPPTSPPLTSSSPIPSPSLPIRLSLHGRSIESTV